MKKQRPKRAAQARPGSVRIIGGRWRGRRIALTGLPPDVRPTPDRVRETLFNWLTPWLPGRHCLDLFAGSGVLGLEALSRGAASCLFIERRPRAAAAITGQLQRLDGSGDVLAADVLACLRGAPPRQFGIVFADPPYADQSFADLCTLLDRGWLAANAFVYLEMSRRSPPPELPPGWSGWREQTAGEVSGVLVRRQAAEPGPET
ncbi:MAG: 16S rRNA (guanine(966)-N(2))-methyltransferase RsmD [Chromatiales bacterium]|nr:16S rRNA (guanine(966)-N(2))-methyltransferase RsmD [Chromatiales bacterium]